MTSRCAICGDQLDRHRGARGERCGTCSRFHQRNRIDRSDKLIIKLTERDIERALSKQRRT